MKSGQFYRGKMDGIQKHFESAGIEKLLPTDKLCVLADYIEIGEYTHFFKQELALAKTVITPAENKDGRAGGILNHTVLYQFDRTITHEVAQYTFNVDAFVLEIQEGKRHFKMPVVPELPDGDSGSIPLPSPIEWETQP